MLQYRHREIMRFLAEERFVKVEQLAEKFKVSTETIRRDLNYLEDHAMLKRVHGGAIFDGKRSKEVLYDQREKKDYQEKRAIANLTATLINDGDSIAINTGTTTLEVAKSLTNKNNLTVITNSLDIAVQMVNNETNSVFLAGGQLRKAGLGVSGAYSNKFLSHFRVDKVIISIGGISIDCGVTEYHVEESYVVRSMIEISDICIVVSDYSKFKVTALNKVCDVNDVDFLVTDWNTPLKEIQAYKNLNVKTLVAERAL